MSDLRTDLRALADEWARRMDVPGDGTLDLTAKPYREAAAKLRAVLDARSEVGCYICRPDDPATADGEGCADCDREHMGAVMTAARSQRLAELMHEHADAPNPQTGGRRCAACDFQAPWTGTAFERHVVDIARSEGVLA